MEYKIVQAFVLENLVRDVNEALTVGWELQGGLAVSCLGDNCKFDFSFAQAMTRKV